VFEDRVARIVLGEWVVDDLTDARIRSEAGACARPELPPLSSVDELLEEGAHGDASPGSLSLHPRAALMVEPKTEHCGF